MVKGETLGGLARRYGVTVGQLRSWNGPSVKGTLKIGQRVRVETKTVHVVRRGETLASLARRYRVTVTALMMANGIGPGADLKAGKRLRIPG